MRSVTGTTPAHYARLGLTPGVVAAWEDGLRTDPGETSFEWWYFDALLECGTKITVEFHTKPPFVSPSSPLTPFVSVTIDRPDGTNVTRTLVADASDFHAASDRCDVRIGACTFAGDLHRYAIHVEVDDLVADLTLTGIVAPWRPATGHVFLGADEERYVAWLPSVPRGAVTGTLRIGGEGGEVRGTGYHDHNWGNAALRRLVDHWYWARARIGDYTAIALHFTSREEDGANLHPAFMVARGDEILASGEDAAAIDFTAGDWHRHPGTDVPVAGRLTYAFGDDDDRFAVSFARRRDVFELDFGAHGAYLRFDGEVTLERRRAGAAVERVSGEALWELLYFGDRSLPTQAAPLSATAGPSS